MNRLARIAVVGGDTAGARAVAGAVVSLLTAVGRWVEEVPADADLDPYAAVVLPRSRGWRTVRERHPGPLVVVDADLLGGRPDAEFLPLLSGAPRATLAIGDTHALLPCPLPPLGGAPPRDAPPGLLARSRGAPRAARLLAAELHLQLGPRAAARAVSLRASRLSRARAAFLPRAARRWGARARLVLHRFPAALRRARGVRAAPGPLLPLGGGDVGPGRAVLPSVSVARATGPFPRSGRG